jgi:hypothetical protein
MENNKYYNSKIYKLVSDNTDKIYIGSTLKDLSIRKALHKKKYGQFKKNKYHYVSSYELMKLGEIDIILIENVKCENKEELYTRERYYIELNKELCVNKNIPIRTKEEKLEQFNCECGGKFIFRSKSIHLKGKKHLKFINDTLNQV